MKTRYIILMAWLGGALAPAKAQVNEEVFRNPAMQGYRDSVSLTEVSVGYDYRHATAPMRLEQGDGHSRAFANVDAFLRKGKTTLWGNAYYGNGSTRNVQFCETSDFELLYPYVMADTVGGKTQQERYRFMGGFSCQMGRWNVAAEGSYTALMEYRTRDPRPKNLSGDLQARLAASFRLGNPCDGYVLALEVNGRKYKQTNEVKLYNEVSVPTIYHLTGLGNDYYRFRGVNTSTYYKGYGVGAVIDWSRVSGRGWFAHADYGYLDIDKIISTLNELPMANIKEYREKMTFGYITDGDRNVFGWNLSEQWVCRRGREYVFGSAQDNIYPQISTMAPYTADKACLSTELSYRHIFRNRSEFSVEWNTRFDGWEESYESPYRDLEGGAWVNGLALSGKVNAKDWQMKLQLAAEWQTSTLDEFYLSDEEVNQTLLAPVEHYYDYLSCDRQFFNALLEAGYSGCKRFVPFVRVGWQYARYMGSEHQNHLTVAMGVKF